MGVEIAGFTRAVGLNPSWMVGQRAGEVGALKTILPASAVDVLHENEEKGLIGCSSTYTLRWGHSMTDLHLSSFYNSTSWQSHINSHPDPHHLQLMLCGN